MIINERLLRREFLAFFNQLLRKRRANVRIAAPRLTDAEVDRLVSTLQSRPITGRDPVFTQLYRNFEGLINSALNAVKTRHPGVDEDDLRSSAWEGFRDAIQSYKTGGGAQFSTFLYNGLIRAMENAAAATGVIYVPTSAKAEGQAILRFIEKEKKEGRETPSTETIVKEMIRQHQAYQKSHNQPLTTGGWNEKKVIERLEAVGATKSLDEVLPGAGEDEGERHLMDVIEGLEDRPDQPMLDKEFKNYVIRKVNSIKILPKGNEMYDIFVLKLGSDVFGDEYDKILEKYKIPDDDTLVSELKPNFSDKKMTGKDLYNRGRAEKNMWIAAITGIGDFQGTTVKNRFDAALDFF
jgi:DNA-directed RNA polymerase specialized sigma subunit